MGLTKKELKETKDYIIDIVNSIVRGTNHKVIVEGNVIKGIVPRLTKRDVLISTIAKKLKADENFKNSEAIKVTTQKAVMIGQKKISSGSNVIKIVITDTKPEEIMAITVKPGTALVSLLPADMGIVGTMNYAEYITKVRFAIKELPEEKAPKEYRDFLNDVFTAALSSTNAIVPKMPGRLNAYVVDEVLADISKTFSEVLGPALVNKHLPKQKIKTVIFPTSKNEREYDFKIVTEDDIMMSYSVKSGVAKVTNTVKPNDINARLKKNLGGTLDKATMAYTKKRTSIVARKIIEILSDNKPTEGAIEAAKFLNKDKKKQNLTDSVKLLQDEPLQLNALMSMAFKDELSFLKYVLNKNGSSKLTIVSGKQIKDLEKKLKLRSKGIRQGPTSKRLTEKMGVTPP